MSYIIIKQADPDNNSYQVLVPGYDDDLTWNAQNTTWERLSVDERVELVDINNLPPHRSYQHGNLRLRRYSSPPKSRWFSAEDMWGKDLKANLAVGFMYASERNPLWQVRCPVHRRGVVEEIIGYKTMDVLVEIEATYKLMRCVVDYPGCYTKAFEEGDEVVVKFTNNEITQPVVIGFWDDPKGCPGEPIWIEFVEYYAGGYPSGLSRTRVIIINSGSGDFYEDVWDNDSQPITPSDWPVAPSVLTNWVSHHTEITEDLWIDLHHYVDDVPYEPPIYDEVYYITSDAADDCPGVEDAYSYMSSDTTPHDPGQTIYHWGSWIQCGLSVSSSSSSSSSSSVSSSSSISSSSSSSSVSSSSKSSSSSSSLSSSSSSISSSSVSSSSSNSISSSSSSSNSINSSSSSSYSDMSESFSSSSSSSSISSSSLSSSSSSSNL